VILESYFCLIPICFTEDMPLARSCCGLLKLTLDLFCMPGCLSRLPLMVVLARTNLGNESHYLIKRYPGDLYFMLVVLNGFARMK
jgi:hypothetical protein